MVVGFNQAIPSEDDALEEQEGTSRSSEDAGWTVVCNDRAVLFCDRSELTGWGESGVATLSHPVYKPFPVWLNLGARIQPSCQLPPPNVALTLLHFSTCK